MKKNYALVAFLLIATLFSCKEQKNNAKEKNQNPNLVDVLAEQYNSKYPVILEHLNNKRFIPRTLKNDSIRYVSAYDWTSGFYPGTLWHLYKLTGNKTWKERATLYTEKLDTIQYWQHNHDVGFMMECSYGNGIKYGEKNYEDIIVQTAKSLATRFNKNVGAIKSWEWSKKWKSPVIIDNMMNLELLFNATRISKDSTYYNIAVSHAKTTIKNHFRDDYSSYHVIDYDPETGEVLAKHTHQGLKHESSWARGQAWGLYGYTMCYKETKDPEFLEQAKNIANYIINHPSMPKDKIPYWDYHAPNEESTPRDASAAAVTASALYNLIDYVNQDNANTYKAFADNIMESLSSPKYLAKTGTNGGFLLMHSVGNKNNNVEVDEPLNYADYYFTEALIRRNK